MDGHVKGLITGLLFAALALPATGREGLAWVNEAPSGVGLEHRVFQDSGFEAPAAGEVGGFRSGALAAYRWAGGVTLSAGYSYDAMDFELPAAQAPPTTGDLHTLNLALGWRGPWAGGAVSVVVAPAVSASSNAIKEPGHWRGNMAQLWGAAYYARPRGAGDWLLGLAHDYRFGEGRIYPLLGWRWAGDHSRVRLVYPDLLLERDLGTTWTLSLMTGPDGSRWRVFDDDQHEDQALVREAWQTEVRLRKRWRQRFELSFSLGYLWHQRWSFSDRGGARQRLESENTPTAGLHLRWLYPDGSAKLP
jgi:hypothetical protein